MGHAQGQGSIKKNQTSYSEILTFPMTRLERRDFCVWLLKMTFSTLSFFDGAGQILWYHWQQAPSPGMEFRKPGAAVC